jgi:hypothetical protein
MSSLPNCSIPMPEEEVLKHFFPAGTLRAFRTNNKEEYPKLMELATEYIGADCWALTVNDEIIFNSYETYQKEGTFNQDILNDIKHDAISDAPHRYLLCKINNSLVDIDVNIYMFGTDSYKLNIHYSAAEKTYTCTMYMSAEYELNMIKL